MMTALLWVLLGLVVAYFCVVKWQMSLPITVRVAPFWMRWVLTWAGMEVLTLWRTVYLRDITVRLSVSAKVHEIEEHIKVHWAHQPYTFLFRYLYANWRYGYLNNPYEIAARRRAGEPVRPGEHRNG